MKFTPFVTRDQSSRRRCQCPRLARSNACPAGWSRRRDRHTLPVVRALLCVLGVAVTGSTVRARAADSADAIDWPSFLARNDLTWSAMPRSWEEGGMLGNGLLGAMVYAPGDGRVVWIREDAVLVGVHAAGELKLPQRR